MTSTQAHSPTATEPAFRFPPGFLWGAATAAHQVEGGNRANDWWVFEEAGKLPFRSGDACRHYELFEQDFDLARAWGHNAHRFSIEWSRIEPRQGAWDLAAVDHYREVIEALRTRGMEPVVTLHHFTNPAWFADAGGWLVRRNALHFARYVEFVAEQLGDRVRWWLTINEPTVYAKNAFVAGNWPPCRRGDWAAAWRAMRNMGRAHRLAYEILHQHRGDALVGFAHSAPLVVPRQPAGAMDRMAASLRDLFLNRVPVRLMAGLAGGQLDFFGLNYYCRTLVRWQPRGTAALFGTDWLADDQGEPRAFSDIGWEIYPAGLKRQLARFARYGVPVLITENGLATTDEEQRLGFLRDHLGWLAAAVADGIPVAGYLYWSLMDNYEWSSGTAPRFGLAATDFATQERTPRPAARYFAEICKANALPYEPIAERGPEDTTVPRDARKKPIPQRGSAMTTAGKRPNLLRMRRGHEHARVGFVELFFDLVFVFAITQLSHAFLEHFTLLGAIQTTLLLMAVWWVWIHTSWVTNWLDPETPAVRLMLFVLMLAGLVLSTSLPEAFGSRGLVFAAAYVFMQVGRSLFMMWALGPGSPRNRRNFQRITAWLVLSGVFWIVGGLSDGATRFGLWALALFLDYLSPAVGFFVPGLGRSTTADWDVEGGHVAERCGLFIIIALGESILVTGATFSSLPWTPPTAAAFVTAFVGSMAMWWIYFSIGAERGSRLIATAADPGRLARLAYTYIHLLIVAGIIVAAVADEFVLAHPTGHIDLETTVAVLSGPALFLVGNILFKRTTADRLPLSHLVGLVVLVLLVPISLVASPLMLAAAAALVLVLVAIWEWLSLGPVVAATLHA